MEHYFSQINGYHENLREHVAKKKNKHYSSSGFFELQNQHFSKAHYIDIETEIIRERKRGRVYVYKYRPNAS